MLDIVLATTAPIAIRFSAKDSGKGARLSPVYCMAACEGEIQVIDEPHHLARCIRPGRCISNRIRARGGRSRFAISGVAYDWTPFEASHIFPPEKESLWVSMTPSESQGPARCGTGFLFKPNNDNYLINT